MADIQLIHSQKTLYFLGLLLSFILYHPEQVLSMRFSIKPSINDSFDTNWHKKITKKRTNILIKRSRAKVNFGRGAGLSGVI